MRTTALASLGVLIFGLSTVSSPLIAQENYPSAPIRLVVGFPPGAGTDAIARLLAQTVLAQMQANVYAENRAGAGGNIGAELVAKARADGHTLLFNTSSVTVSRALGEKLNHDLLNDLAPASLAASSPYVLSHAWRKRGPSLWGPLQSNTALTL